MKKTLSYDNLNLSPALTWNWLKMNRGALKCEIEDSVFPCAVLRGSDNGMAIYKDEGAGCQLIKDLNKSLPDINHICSTDTNDVINSLNTIKFAVVAQEKCTEPLVINFNLKENQTYSGSQTIVAEENSEITVVMDFTSLPFDSGFCAIQTKLWAKAYSKIHLVKVQTLGQKYIHIDDTQSYAEDGATIEVTQIELGAAQAFVNVTSNLEGYKSKFKSDTAYICKDQQKYDINYAVAQKGQQSDAKMLVKGVVKDNAVKTYRGTIDFKNGCAGSTGDEQEEVLILSPSAVNKSLPTILCDEEDVSGTHGATLGRLGNDELFYFQSRGISEEEAEKIMTRAKILAVASDIPDANTVKKIKEFIGDETGISG